MCVPLPVDVGDDGLRDYYAAAYMDRAALARTGPTWSHNERIRFTLSSNVVYPMPFGSVEWIAQPSAESSSVQK